MSPTSYQTAPFRDNLHVLYQAFLGLNRRACTPFVILGLEPNNLPDCSIPRQLTHSILNFSGSTEGRVLPSSVLVCEPAELSDCSIPRQIFRGMALKSVALYVLPRRCQSLFRYIHFILECHRFCSRKNQLL